VDVRFSRPLKGEACNRSGGRFKEKGLEMSTLQAAKAEGLGKAEAEPVAIDAAGRLGALGQALYGEHWMTPMARDLKMRHDTIAAWVAGRRQLPSDHPIFSALVALIHHHDKGVAKARAILDRNSDHSAFR
jgi:hypothetical protein